MTLEEIFRADLMNPKEKADLVKSLPTVFSTGFFRHVQADLKESVYKYNESHSFGSVDPIEHRLNVARLVAVKQFIDELYKLSQIEL